MSVAWVGVGVGVAGIAASAYGASQSAKAAGQAADATNQAGADARNQYDEQTAMGALRQLAMLYGPEDAQRIFKATFPKETVNKIFGQAAVAGTPGTPGTGNMGRDFGRVNDEYDAARSQLAEAERKGDWFNVQRLRPQVETLRGQLNQSRGEAPTDGTPGTDAVPGSLDVDAFNNMGPGVQQQMEGYRAEAKTAGDQYLGGYDRGTRGLLRQSQGIEKASMGFGDSERKRINRDAGTALTGANRVTESRLRANGLGSSSVLGNQLAGNARNIYNSQQDQLGQLGDRQNMFNTGLRQNTLGLNSQRTAGRDAASMQLQERDLGLAARPIDMRLQTATNAAMNPWLGQNTTQYFPGASGGGGAIMGQFASGVGGQLAGWGMQSLTNQQQLQQYQEMMRRNQGGGGGGPSGFGNYGGTNFGSGGAYSMTG